VAIEDAGFELRDSIAWLYGSGFPKSLDISKAIDKQAGAEREVLTEVVSDLFGDQEVKQERKTGIGTGKGSTAIMGDGNRDLTMPATPEAQQWQGWGTALKPAFEPVIVARKPIEGTVANNVLKWGTGGLNIDGSRIAGEVPQFIKRGNEATSTYGDGLNGSARTGEINTQGRWPANIILDPYTAELLDEQSGTSKGQLGMKRITGGKQIFDTGGRTDTQSFQKGVIDVGGASRFFYVAKASKRDRNEGLEELEAEPNGLGALRDGGRESQPRQNFHPTVKPTSLMEYLIKLVTPPQGTVLDPFTGSGSTGKAAILQGFDFIGIEMTEEYLPIIEGRLKHAEAKVAERIKETADQEQEKLF
jgi:site-specific DNA-methyltransferase (adenine-specific)